MVVTLIGYRGSGKSSVARLVAEQLRAPFRDSDDMVEESAGISIREIFEQAGEHEFRRMECDVIAQLTAQDSIIISAGGGAILSAENRARMRAAGPVVWLQADAATLASRISRDESTTDRRPSLTGEPVQNEIAAVLSAREPLYRDASTMTVATDDMTPEEVAAEILRRLHDGNAT